MNTPQIRLATLDDVPSYYEHLKRHGNESGRNGDLIFSPYEESWDRPFDTFQKEKKEKWQRPVLEVGWERCWLVTEGPSVYGELRLTHAIGLKTTLHRCLLMMAIERSHRTKGLGTGLMTAALEWAKNQPSLAWIQLNVFAHNEPARNLYRRFGFQEIGTNQDLFRIYGQRIDDIEMSLKISREAE